MEELSEAKVAAQKLAKNSKKALDFKKTFGIPNWVLFHGWNSLMILDAFGKYLWFQTSVFGHPHNENRGLMSMYSQEYLGLAIGIIYFYFFCAGKDQAYVAAILFKLNMIFMFIIMVFYLMDALLWIFDEHTFCNM